MRGVKPIKHDRADTGKPKADRAQCQAAPGSASCSDAPRWTACPTSSSSTSAEDELMWARDGVQESQMRKLKIGQIPSKAASTCTA
jgi:DNA-nicking Smr family endonuclease